MARLVQRLKIAIRIDKKNNKIEMKYEYYYQRNLIKDLIIKKSNSFQNLMQKPTIEKVVIDTTTSKVVTNTDFLIICLSSLESISGQKPKLTYATKSVANFKLRKNQVLGCMLTLRKKKLYMFLNKLLFTVLPQDREFWGIDQRPWFLRNKVSFEENRSSLEMSLNRNRRIEDSPSLFLRCASTKGASDRARATTALGVRNLMLFPEIETHYDLFAEAPGANINITFVQKNKTLASLSKGPQSPYPIKSSKIFVLEMASFLRLMG